jgi:hypothetical protein
LFCSSQLRISNASAKARLTLVPRDERHAAAPTSIMATITRMPGAARTKSNVRAKAHVKQYDERRLRKPTPR